MSGTPGARAVRISRIDSFRNCGYAVVARNWRAEDGSGELDLVAWDGASLVVVEVKSRASTDFGLPEDAVDAAKRTHLIRTAARYAREAEIPLRLASFRHCERAPC